MDGGKTGERKGPAHARGHTLPKGNEERLAELGKLLPPPSDDELQIIRGLRHERFRRRLVGWLIAIVLIALLAGAIAQWVRPLPASTLEIQGVRLPGAAPTFAWPSTGEAAAAVEGSGTLGERARIPARSGRRADRRVDRLRGPLRSSPGTRGRRTCDPRNERHTHGVPKRAGKSAVRGSRRRR